MSKYIVVMTLAAIGLCCLFGRGGGERGRIKGEEEVYIVFCVFVNVA